MTSQDTLSDQPLHSELDGFGTRLGLVIQHLSISQSEFARQIDTSPGFVSNVLRGQKKPGAEMLRAVVKQFGVSADWLLTGCGTMFGASTIDIELFKAVRLQVAIARSAVVESDATAAELLKLIRDGRMIAALTAPTLLAFLEQLPWNAADVDLAVELYNGHAATADPGMRQRNLMTAAVAHFEARKPLNKLATIAQAAGVTLPQDYDGLTRTPQRARHDVVTDIMLTIFRLNSRLLEKGDKLVAPLELTSARWQVMGAVALAMRPLTVPQIADAMGVTRQGAQKQLNRLLDEGLFECQPNPRHERSPFYALTEKGMRQYAIAMELETQWAALLGERCALPDLESALNTLLLLHAQLHSTPLPQYRPE